MKKKFAAFDIDGTLFRSGLYREVVFELMKMDVLDPELIEKANEKMREWRHRLHGNAFEEFELVLTSRLDEQVAMLKISDYEEAARRVIEAKADDVYVYTRELLKELKQKGYFLIAISGSQVELVEPFAQKYGFDDWIGQTWERGEEFFTGKITKTHTGKDVLLNAFIEKHNLSLEESWAVGDSNGDVGMLAMVQNPVAFNPTFELAQKARDNGWHIVIERKNVIYEMSKGKDAYILDQARPF